MKPISVWAANAQSELADAKPISVSFNHSAFEAFLVSDSLWLTYTWPDQSRINFRLAYSPSGNLELKACEKSANQIRFVLACSTLNHEIIFKHLDQDEPNFSYTTTITPKLDLLIPFWPKDMLSFNKTGKIRQDGEIHTQQVGTRSGVLYFNDGAAGSVFYFQNLTALNDYCQATETSASELVGGSWPEIGFSLPPTKKNLEKGISYIISDAFVRLSPKPVSKHPAISIAYLNHLAETYVQIPKPERHYHNWLETVEKGLSDLVYHKGCWTFAGGHSYLNAYVADYKSPPEVMVQLAVLMPMLEYIEWKGETSHQLISEIEDGLPGFYEPDMKTIVRWLPAVEDQLDHSEEQKNPRVMDSWYLHHPLMNLARLTQRGNKMAKKLLLDSIDYPIRVAHKFNYQWPVFYQMDTLAIIKAETAPGNGGEKDVPGTYADLMHRVWKITGEKKYLKEAITSAKKLTGLGFDIFYQANNTAFTAGAMLRLYKETNDKTYLEISYQCIAAIFNNVQLWECDYGHGKNISTFFAVFPLKDAPYTAAYEEQEVYAALHDYLKEAEDIEILPAIRLLIAEFIRHIVGRVVYYYPPMLPSEMIVEKPKTGENDGKLWVALEDLHDGWEQSGEVGQEVYGAGIAFGIIPKQYYRIPNENFILYCDYPLKDFKIKKGKLSFHTQGDDRLNCRVIVLINEGEKDYTFETTDVKAKLTVKPLKSTQKLIEFNCCGNQEVQLKWISK